MYKVVLLFVLCTTVLGLHVDRALEPGTHGRDVVETVVYRIHRSRVFPDDRDFLRRVAYTESKFGDDPQTYRSGYHGGVWQFDRLKKTKYDDANDATSPYLRSIHASIKNKMGIDWMQVKEEDLLKPLYSGLAARIYIDLTSQSRGQIPDDIKGQDKFWKDWYHTQQGKYGDFEMRAKELLERDMSTAGGKIDLMLVVDGSASITKPKFQSALDSLARLVNVFDLQEANVGMVTYSTIVTSVIPFLHNLTMEGLQDAINSTRYPGQQTNTYAGMMEAINQFGTLPNDRIESGIPRLMVVLTDGLHNQGDLKPVVAAKLAAMSGIITCAFGIGDSIKVSELREIANEDPDYIYTVQDYDTLREQIARMARRAKTVPQTPKMGSETSETMKQVGEKRYYRFAVPENGTTIILINEKGEIRGYWTYTSVEQPSSAFYDGVINAGETFIPPPPARQVRQRRDVSQDAPANDVMIALESFKVDSKANVKIVQGDARKSAATKVDVACFMLVAAFSFAVLAIH
ncbi:unnamed protein product [Bemisia tabaci]|uniref:VWFA domain-containing protein n=1 Tax=Bemisia tabaci TaxID=7038 RepID=A0A9P0A9S0_BEMTA|nr:unnamed protein product [Bemisia tabaci]